MIEAPRLLADLKRLRRTLDADLRLTHAAGAKRAAVQAEYDEAFASGRTRETFDAFLDSAFDQAVVHWVLGCVFLRFLEDNGLVDRPFLSGPGERLELAKQRQDAHFRRLPHDGETDYLLATFAEAAALPGLSGLFDPAHNPLFRLPLSGDGAIALLRFFREVRPETGALTHDFCDPDWGTRFLGDLYQDLSEEARKRYALLQTPDFVEAWILDRTLEPAIREFGYEAVRMIDPACGSGHFLLGGFARVLREWQRFAPDMPPAAQAQRALEAVTGVDLNPFAVEIARFRLLVAALRAAGVARLSAAPDFRMHLAAGDSLLHGRHFFRRELGGAEEGFRRVLRHHYAAEDSAEVDRILGRQYHAVVGNPPYIAPNDAAMRDAYREIYASCHRAYGLGAPFTERFFDLAVSGTQDNAAGFVGLIVDNSFMKRQFGSKLIEHVLARLDLTHVVSCSGVPMAGHNTSTVILFGRNRPPVGTVVRTVRGIRGDPDAVADPGRGQLWTAILTQIDQARSESAFISTEDTSRTVLARHPWNMGGGGAADVQVAIEDGCLSTLGDLASEIGFGAVTREDDAYLMPSDAAHRHRIPPNFLKIMVEGEDVREYRIAPSLIAIWPYDPRNLLAQSDPSILRLLWAYRVRLRDRVAYGQTQIERGLVWYEYSMFFRNRFVAPLTITFGEVATHNHFVLDRGGKVFNRTAPVIKLPGGSNEDDHLGLLGLLNSSTACFWLKARCKDKGGDHVGTQGARIQNTSWDDRYAFNATNIGQFPLVSERPVDLARSLDTEAQRLSANVPAALAASAIPTREALDSARAEVDAARARMIALQEELDWGCYRLYGLLESAPEHQSPPPLRLGERAFEIVMARRVAAGDLETTWFVRHGTASITELPTHWSDAYRAVVERRIGLIESDSTIGLIERPEYKRRWVSESWEDMEHEALRNWLLDRLEAPHLWQRDDPRLVSTNQLADLVRRDADFLSVAALYAGRPDVPLEALLADLVAKQAVPFLAALRYVETGLRKRAQWEDTWDKQRQEDAIDVEVEAQRETFRAQAELRAQDRWRGNNPRRPSEAPEAYATRMATGVAEGVAQEADRLVAEEQRRRKAAEVRTIPVPPKYVTKDFQSADFWRQRNGLDVAKERFVSFPHCQRDADGSLVVTWAGHDNLARARAIATYYLERKDGEGWPPERLVPLLAGLIELLPWLRQWHNAYDPDTGVRMGDYFSEFVRDEARALGMTEAAVAAWTPPAVARRGRGRRAAA